MHSFEQWRAEFGFNVQSLQPNDDRRRGCQQVQNRQATVLQASANRRCNTHVGLLQRDQVQRLLGEKSLCVDELTIMGYRHLGWTVII